MAKVVIDGKEYEVNPDNNLLQECLSQGLDLPYFCWHPCMGSVGACRQCAVKQYRDEDDKQGMLVMACMTPATDGSIISINDGQATEMREKVIESLMISHPHDCPVCEEGGECHLQDMTLMSGHNYRRYDKKKVTHRNQYLGPFINHEMNRCITCYRCVRYYDDYAGGTDLAAQASHHHTYFGRHEEGVLESEFSGNLVEVCPTGVFTDKSFSEHYSRKWDLQTAPSVCTGCSVGCNTTPGERYGSLRRIVNRYNSEINGYFLCDRGRFGFDYINSKERIQQAVSRSDGQETELSVDDAEALIEDLKGGAAIGIGSPRASNEANYALRNLVGADNFYVGIAEDEHAVNQLILQLNRDEAFHSPSIREIEQADAVLIIGEDITNTGARVALAVRQSAHNRARTLASDNNIPQWQDAAVRELAQHDRSPVSIIGGYASRLDDVASEVYVDSYTGQAAVAQAIAAELDGSIQVSGDLSDEQRATARAVADHLASAKRPLVISGSSNGQMCLVQAAANVARALHSRNGSPTDLCLLVRESNTMGLEMLATEGNSLNAALEKMTSGTSKAAIVLENDLYRRAATDTVDKALAAVEQLVAIDQMPTATTAKASYVLPSTGFSEHEATTINYEGRAQLSYQVHRSSTGALPAWRWLSPGETEINGVISRCSEEAAGFEKLESLVAGGDEVVAGMKVPRQSHRYSGRTAMIANINVHEPKQPQDNQSPLSFSMEGMPATKDCSILGASWSPGWNSNQSISKFQDEVNGELKQGDTGTLLLQRNQNGSYLELSAPANEGGEYSLIRAFQIFGSDELSAKASPIQQRLTDPYVSLAPTDAEKLGVKQGDSVSINGNGKLAAVCIRSHMKPGTVALYVGDDHINQQDLGSALDLQKSAETVGSRGVSGLIVSDLYEEGY